MVGGGRFELPNPKEQIYSLPRLATSLPAHYDAGIKNNKIIKYIITTIKIGNISLSFITLTLFNKKWCPARESNPEPTP